MGWHGHCSRYIYAGSLCVPDRVQPQDLGTCLLWSHILANGVNSITRARRVADPHLHANVTAELVLTLALLLPPCH